MTIKRIFLLLYIITGVAELMAISFEATLLHHFTKPLLMVWLALYFVSDASNRSHKLLWIIILALVFSWLGDVALMYQEKDSLYFMLGLGSFLVAHIFYILSCRKARIDNYSQNLSKPRVARYNFFLLLIFLALITVLKPHLGQMLGPVLVYAAAITYMAMSALNRFGKTSMSSFGMVMIGALTFMFSDSTIAINKFLEPINQAPVIIMSTYMIAQYLLIEGLSKHIKLSDN